VSSHRQSKRRKKETSEVDSSTPQTLESYDVREVEEENAIVADLEALASEMEQPN
jgi:tRNA (adenine-N(1)-)-methyltransferase non-catalytic subunit